MRARRFQQPFVKLTLLSLMAFFLLGCVATAAQWMAYAYVNPDQLNEVVQDSDGRVVHVSEQGDGIHVTAYDSDGVVVLDTIVAQSIDDSNGVIDINDQRLLIAGETLASATLVDVNLHQAMPLDDSMLPGDVSSRSLGGISAVMAGNVVAYGSHNDQGWLLVMDFVAGSSQLLELVDTVSVDAVFAHTYFLVEVETATARQVLMLDSVLNELGRFDLSHNNESLIGDSLGRAVLFNSSNHNVRVVDHSGASVWEFENAEFEYIKGQSVGPGGRTLLWGDNSQFNPLSSVAEDSAHFLLISADGDLLYHYVGGSPMAKIAYTHVKQFDSGKVQVSFQGWSGELAGFLIGSNLGTPFTVSRRVYHDFISLAGNKSRWMREPVRTETYAQCGTFCIGIVSEAEGHCDNLDVFNIDDRSLISLSQVCGAKTDDGGLLPNTVKVSLY
jgi:hypothetical protein